MNSTTVIAPTNGADAARTPKEAEPIKLLRRIGSTTYEVTIHFSNTGKDTMADILRRVLEREVERND
jgi:hypothetical protein